MSHGLSGSNGHEMDNLFVVNFFVPSVAGVLVNSQFLTIHFALDCLWHERSKIPAWLCGSVQCFCLSGRWCSAVLAAGSWYTVNCAVSMWNFQCMHCAVCSVQFAVYMQGDSP